MAKKPADTKSKKTADTAKTTKKRVQTVRERTQLSAQPEKQRRLKRTANSAGGLFKSLGRFIAKIAHPFRFLLRPFKTRPMRFVGRILSKVLFLSYFKHSWLELRKVTWPTRKETWKLTGAVFLFAIVFGLVIAIVDYGLDKLFKKILL